MLIVWIECHVLESFIVMYEDFHSLCFPEERSNEIISLHLFRTMTCDRSKLD